MDNCYWEHTTGSEAGHDKNSLSEYAEFLLVWRLGWMRRRLFCWKLRSRLGGGLVSKKTLKTSVVPRRVCKSDDSVD